jgi:hypothetical protein
MMEEGGVDVECQNTENKENSGAPTPTTPPPSAYKAHQKIFFEKIKNLETPNAKTIALFVSRFFKF